jgi:hypothetical protein
MASRQPARALAAVGLLVGVGALTAALTTDVHAHTRDRNEHAALATAEQQLAASQSDLTTAHEQYSVARSDLTVTLHRTALTADERTAIQTSVAATLRQLTTAANHLSDTKTDAFLQDIKLGTLQSCLAGVQRAFQQIAKHNNKQAAHDLSDVSAACSTPASGNGQGLVYPFDFPDPDIVRLGNTYFGYATNSVGGNIQIIDSTNLTHWNALGNALSSLPTWAAPDATWAPAVAQIARNFVLYYAARVAGPGGGEECVSLATATQPQGPFVDTSTAPLEYQPSLGGSLDPSPFIDTDGKIYLTWKSGGTGQATIWSEQLNPTGTQFTANTTPTQLLIPDQTWEAGIVEAPDLVTSDGRYFLFYSGNDWNSANYAIGIATCAGPLGPCTKPTSQPLLASNSTINGPGGASVFTDTTGSTWIAYHAWNPGAVGYPHNRDLYLQRIDLSDSTPDLTPAG